MAVTVVPVATGEHSVVVGGGNTKPMCRLDGLAKHEASIDLASFDSLSLSQVRESVGGRGDGLRTSIILIPAGHFFRPTGLIDSRWSSGGSLLRESQLPGGILRKWAP